MSVTKHLVCLLLSLWPWLGAAVLADEPVRLGVLAYRGEEAATQLWEPLAEQLSRSIPGYRFSVIPYALSELTAAVAAGEVDLVLTNPGHYVLLERQHRATRIATLKKLRADAGATMFGAVIFTRADRPDINSLGDLKGRRFAAVSEDAFGGFQMAWRELQEADLDPFSDLDRLEFLGFPQDNIVLAVQRGSVDAGTVRSGVLEQMAVEGRIRLEDFRVLNRQLSPGFVSLLSTRLYPEWPLAKVGGFSDELAERIVVALLTQPSGVAGITWTIPQDYSPVHDLMRTLKIGPYLPKKPSLLLLLTQYRGWLLSAVSLMLVLVLATVMIARSNKQLVSTQRVLREEISRREAAQKELSDHRDNLERLVSARTEDLRRLNLRLEDDIVARKRAEQALRHSDHTLRNLHYITSAPDTPIEAKVVALLDAGCKHFGLGLGLLTAFREGGGEIIEMVSTLDSTSQPRRPSAGDDFCDELPRLVDPVGVADARNTDWHGGACLMRHGWGCYLGACVHVGGEPYGTLSFLDQAAREPQFSDFDLDIVQLIADWIGWEVDRQRVQEQSQRHIQELAHVSRVNTMGEMASGMAHEINQPLTAIVNYTRGCIRRLESNNLPREELKAVLNTTAEEADRAAMIIKRLRQLVSKNEYSRKRIAVQPLVNRAVSLMSAELRENQVGVETRVPKDIHDVEADPIQIEQVLINLLRNALDALRQVAPPGRRIVVEARMKDGQELEIAVEDNGRGLPDNADVFTPFFTTRDEGMGMGLSISRTIIESHGGAMRAFMTAESKTRVSFTMPVVT